MTFSAPPHFFHFPHLSCKAHRGERIGKTSLEVQQKAHGSCPDGLPVCLAQASSHNPPTPVVCGVTVIPVSPRRSIHSLPSQLVQPHSAKGGAVSPTSMSLWATPACHPEAAGDKLCLPLAKAVSQRWNSFLLQLLKENINCSCCFCCTAWGSSANPGKGVALISGWTKSSCRCIQFWASAPTYPIGTGEMDMGR